MCTHASTRTPTRPDVLSSFWLSFLLRAPELLAPRLAHATPPLCPPCSALGPPQLSAAVAATPAPPSLPPAPTPCPAPASAAAAPAHSTLACSRSSLLPAGLGPIQPPGPHSSPLLGAPARPLNAVGCSEKGEPGRWLCGCVGAGTTGFMCARTWDSRRGQRVVARSARSRSRALWRPKGSRFSLQRVVHKGRHKCVPLMVSKRVQVLPMQYLFVAPPMRNVLTHTKGFSSSSKSAELLHVSVS